MKLTVQLQLLPTAEQASALLDTLSRFNEAATFAARVGFADGTFTQAGTHRLCYYAIRARFGLSAQMAVRAIGKAVETFARDRSQCPEFRSHGAMARSSLPSPRLQLPQFFAEVALRCYHWA